MKTVAGLYQPLIPHFDIPTPFDFKKLFNNHHPVEVEIGFGMGEFLIRSAIENPDINYIGLEQHWERILKTLKSMDRHNQQSDIKIENIRILKVDARDAFHFLFKEKSIAKIYCLFPCPWPKKGHVKHRLFSSSFLSLINSRLVKGGEVQLVTDYYPFYEWVVEEIDSTVFDYQMETITPQFKTKFEYKWQEEGQQEFFQLYLQKKKKAKAPTKKVYKVKSFKIQNFNSEKFKFENVKDDIAIILKSQHYDQQAQSLLLRLIVSEDHLMQDFWVTIRRDKECWRIHRTEGQRFFPTRGIVKALDTVYASAMKSV